MPLCSGIATFVRLGDQVGATWAQRSPKLSQNRKKRYCKHSPAANSGEQCAGGGVGGYSSNTRHRGRLMHVGVERQ